MIFVNEKSYQWEVTMKSISLEMTVFDMIEKYPETKELLAMIGLNGVENPLMLKTAGKKMTIQKGAKLKKIPWEDVVTLFEKYNFTFKENNND